MVICVVVGTRPEIIKMSCILHELTEQKIPFTLVHTGQHYDAMLSSIFFDELEIGPPDLNLEVGSGSQAIQTATALTRLEESFTKINPDLILVEGDTNTVLAAALAGAKLGIKVGHVEAGLRSFDLRMPEEHNRRLTDHLSSYLFAPTPRALNTLAQESCWGKSFLTGNTVIDACIRYGETARHSSTILKGLPQKFALATIHRAENVDDPSTLRRFFEIFARSKIPIVCPLHPRTRLRIQDLGLGELADPSQLFILPPLGYLDFLCLLMSCQYALTDSGGIQEEATAPNIRKKVFVLRENTERPEAVESGFAEVVGTQPDRVLSSVGMFGHKEWKNEVPSPFGDGKSAVRIVNIIRNDMTQHEPLVVC